MDEQQIQQTFEELRKQIELSATEQRVLGSVSKDTKDAMKRLTQSLQKAGANLGKLAKAAEEAEKAEQKQKEAKEKREQEVKAQYKELGGSVKGLAGSVASGNTSFAQFSGVVKSVTATLGKLLGAIPLAGKYLEKGAQATGEAAAFIINQVDPIVKAYAELGQVGAQTARGVAGMRDQFNRLGLVGLPEFTKAVKENGQALAALGPTTAKGADKLATSLGNLTDPNGPFVKQFLALGYTMEEITKLSSDFIGNQILLGNRNLKTTRDVTTAMAAYLKEIDAVAAATGKSREQVAEENKKMEADVKFRARMEELRATGMGHVADQMEALARRLGGARGEAFRASVTGVPLTKEAQGAMVLYGGAMTEAVNNLMSGAQAVDEHRRIMERGGRGLESFNRNLQFGTDALGSDTMVLEQMNEERIRQRALEAGMDPFEFAEQERKRLAEARNQETKDLVDGQVAITGLSREMQRLGFDALPVATKAVYGFATTLQKATNIIRQVLGVASAPGGAARDRGFARPLPPGQGVRTPGMPGERQATTGDYLSRLMQLESGGRNIQTQVGSGSSAFGLYQITKTTFDSLVANAPPGSALKGKTFEDMKADTELQKIAATMLTDQNAAMLARRGLSTSDAAKYMSHVLGYGVAARVLEAANGVEIGRLVPDIARQNNPKIFENVRTAGDLRKRFSDITGGGGYAYGGIASGPKSGYATVLHGTEAVVPLPDGKTIPVSLPADFNSGMSRQMEIMGAQLSRLDELVKTMKDQTTISQRILQVSQA